ncbi:MAG: PA14 domain-containing protein [Methylococcaceae bacterium]|jgi:cytochrome c peroxidase
MMEILFRKTFYLGHVIKLWQARHIVLITALLLHLMPAAQAVEFFKDDFERTTLNKSIGSFYGLPQDSFPEGADFFTTTRVWTSSNGIEIQNNGVDGIDAHSGKHRIELDIENVNSTMYTKVNLVNGQSYQLKFYARSRPKTVTTTTLQCTLIVFCKPVTTTKTIYIGGGINTYIEAPFYSSGNFSVGDNLTSWTEQNFRFTYFGPTGEATLSFKATGTADGIGTLLDDISLETTISGDIEHPAALTGILPPTVPGLVSQDTNRNDIITPIIADKNAAIALGKALFWEQGVGSDQMACASCHFSAGADNRVKNQIDPGLNHAASSGTTFENTLSGKKSGPNYTLTKGDFPFPQNSDDIASSSGTFSGQYRNFTNNINIELCDRSVANVFHVNGVGTRNVEPRNTPTTINAAFNFRNFWDGRANNEFNGASTFGPRDRNAGIYINKNGSLIRLPLKLKNSSLASQAVGPVSSENEMACRARAFADVGRKLLNRRPLALQTIAPDDSVLSALPAIIGSNGTYTNLIQKAFATSYWNGNCGIQCGTPDIGINPAEPYTHMEANFSLYFGLSLQMYMDTLISDDSHFDRWKRGIESPTSAESRGENIFNGSQASCSTCHKGPTLSNAVIYQTDENVIEGMIMRNNRYAIYDRGYYNLGLVPTDYDIGGGGKDPFGNTLSFSKQYVSNNFVDDFGVEPCKFEDIDGLCNDSSAAERAKRSTAVDGTFKVPTLRNVELTGPYFHNGSQMNLEQVLDFYNRGGNFDNFDKHPDIHPLGLSAQDISDLVAFLKSLTDNRVKYQKAPFDHPSLTVPNGHNGNQNSVLAGNPIFATFGIDEFLSIPAIGKNGSYQALSSFEEILNGGLNGQYFANSTLSGNPVLGRLENIDFSWPDLGFGRSVSPDPALPSDYFSIRWTGKLIPTVTGYYQLQTLSDDGVRVWINNVLVIDNWTEHPPTINTSNQVYLIEGQNADIKVEYNDYRYGAVIRLEWKTPNASTFNTIPKSSMSPS